MTTELITVLHQDFSFMLSISHGRYMGVLWVWHVVGSTCCIYVFNGHGILGCDVSWQGMLWAWLVMGMMS